MYLSQYAENIVSGRGTGYGSADMQDLGFRPIHADEITSCGSELEGGLVSYQRPFHHAHRHFPARRNVGVKKATKQRPEFHPKVILRKREMTIAA